jgi:hypothetical protein
MIPWIVSGYPSNFLKNHPISSLEIPHKPGFLPPYLRNGITRRKTMSITNGPTIRKTVDDKESPHLLKISAKKHAGFDFGTA